MNFFLPLALLFVTMIAYLCLSKINIWLLFLFQVFDVTEGKEGGLHTAKVKLKPPHYDGIQSLALNDDTLFSGSRDRCIKKWNLKTGSHIQVFFFLLPFSCILFIPPPLPHYIKNVVEILLKDAVCKVLKDVCKILFVIFIFKLI